MRKSFAEWYEECDELKKKTGNPDARTDMIKRIAPISDVTVKELTDSIHFGGEFDELIERIPLYDILLMPGITQNFDS